MDAKTLEALKGSIAHWERVRDGVEPSEGALNCDLCKAFPRCDDGCPVAAKTGRIDCQNTPYWNFCHAAEHTEEGESYQMWARSDTAKAAAQAELDFLRSLLPDADTTEPTP
jgi:hypothetical protein